LLQLEDLWRGRNGDSDTDRVVGGGDTDTGGYSHWLPLALRPELFSELTSCLIAIQAVTACASASITSPIPLAIAATTAVVAEAVWLLCLRLVRAASAPARAVLVKHTLDRAFNMSLAEDITSGAVGAVMTVEATGAEVEGEAAARPSRQPHVSAYQQLICRAAAPIAIVTAACCLYHPGDHITATTAGETHDDDSRDEAEKEVELGWRRAWAELLSADIDRLRRLL
jgi:hypothetical protein